MIRWRFILTRLIVIVAVLSLLRWGLGPVANFVTVQGLQSVTGAKVEIAKTHVGLFPPRIQYVDLQIADPRHDKALRDLLRADTIDLVIDGEALLQRRWVAREGKITGLQIGSRRDDSGHFENVPEPEEPQHSAAASVLGELVKVGVGKIGADAKGVADNLETVRCSKEIRARWEAEYDSLVARARSLESQIREIRDQAKGIDNPLRDWPQMERTLAKANTARSELLSVRETIDSLPQRMQADMARLDDARRMDIAKVDQYVPGDLASSRDFGIDIMTSAVQQQIQRIRDYLDGGRTLANYTVVKPQSERVRGTDFNLNRIERPSVLVHRCEVGGLMRANGEVYNLTGVLENLTPTPELLAEPTRARFRLEGPETVRVEYVRDRRDQQNVDLLTMHWPERHANPIHIGDKDDAGITIAGGQRELWVQIRTENDQIEGRLVSKQTGLTMDLDVNPKYDDSVVVTSLRKSLATIDRIEVDATFAGTWRDIDLNVDTNLGKILHQASQDAIASQVREAKIQMAAKIDQAHREQSQALQEWLGSRQSEARELMASADKTIDEMSKKLLDEMGEADAYLGRLRGAIRGRLR